VNPGASIDAAAYCRDLERYLCQKNGGHLIRIVGPAFEQVRGWAERGISLVIARRGIDRYCERLKARGGSGSRRRPVRIEFCENDILDLFEDWQRTVGVALTPPEAEAVQAAPQGLQVKREALTSHFERIAARLVGRRSPGSSELERHIEQLLQELDRLSASSRAARGEARAAIIERLAVLDQDLMAAARQAIDAETAERFKREAEAELAPFESRMNAEVRAKALTAAVERLVRESLGLPTVRYG
jgi:hypothetical protein